MNHDQFLRWLGSEGACDDAKSWVAKRGHDRETAIRACSMPDWLVWLAEHEGLPPRRAVEVAVICARHVWDLTPDGARPAVLAAEAWLADPCERTAKAAARAARAAEAAARAARAAEAAAWEAAARAAAWAAWAAAAAAAWAAAAAAAAAAWAARVDPTRAPVLCDRLRAELFPEVV